MVTISTFRWSAAAGCRVLQQPEAVAQVGRGAAHAAHVEGVAAVLVEARDAAHQIVERALNRRQVVVQGHGKSSPSAAV